MAYLSLPGESLKLYFPGQNISAMNYSLPHTIENCTGEKLIFQRIEKTPEGDKLIVEGICQPGAGPIMHTHFRQDESITKEAPEPLK